MLLTLHTIACLLLLATTCAAGAAVLIDAVRRRMQHSPRRSSMWIALFIGAFGAALWLRSAAVAPHHAMYLDEPWYIEAAHNLVARGALLLCEGSGPAEVCRPYPKASGWPVMLAGAFVFFGAGSQVAFGLSALLSAAAAPLSGWIARLAGGQSHHVLLAMLLIAVHPLHVLWSATAETNSASTAVLLAGVGALLALLERDSLSTALLAAGALGLAAAMRPELSVALPPALWILIKAAPPVRRRSICIVAAGAALGATSLVTSWDLYLANSGGTFLSLRNLVPNLMHLVSREEGAALTVWILVLAAVGRLVALRRRGRRETALLLSSGALTLLAALIYDQRIFYARTVLGGLVLIVPVAALAVPRFYGAPLRRMIAAAATLVALAMPICLALPALRHFEIPETQVLETRLPRALRDIALPADAVVLAEWPTVLAADTAIAAKSARNYANENEAALAALAVQLEQRPHFLLCDMYCEANFANAGHSGCERLLEQFNLQEVSAISQGGRRYGLYKLVARNTGAPQTAACPFVRR